MGGCGLAEMLVSRTHKCLERSEAGVASSGRKRDENSVSGEKWGESGDTQ